MCLKAFLLARQPFLNFSASSPRTSRAFRGFVLENASQFRIMVANLSYLFPAVFVSLRGYCNICSAQVHTQNPIRFLWQFWLKLQLDIEVVRTILSFQQCSCFRFLSFQQSPLVVTDGEFKPLPTAQQPQANRPVVFPKTKYSLVLGSTGRSKLADWLILVFGSFTVAGNSPHRMNCQLRGQAKSSSDVVVDQRLNSLFVNQPWLHSPIGVLTSIRKRLQQLVNSGNLFRCDLELTRYSQKLLRNIIVSQGENYLLWLKDYWRTRHLSPPALPPHPQRSGMGTHVISLN